VFNSKASFTSKAVRYSTPKSLHMIPIENISFNLINQPRLSYSKTKYEQLKKSIQTHGITNPVTIFCSNSNISNPELIKGDLLDGFNRLLIAKELNIKEIPTIVETDTDEADKIVLFSNTTRSDLHPIERGRLVNDFIKKGLISTQSLTEKYKDIEHYLGWKKSTTQYYELLANSIFDKVGKNLISLDFRNKEKLLKIAKICKSEELKGIGDSSLSQEELADRAFSKIVKIVEKTKVVNDYSEEAASRGLRTRAITDTHNRILYLKNGKGELIGENMITRMSTMEITEIVSKMHELNEICTRVLSLRAQRE